MGINNDLQSQPKPGNRRRIKSVLPGEYTSNTSVGDAGNIEENHNGTEEDQKRKETFQMIQERINAVAAATAP